MDSAKALQELQISRTGTTRFSRPDKRSCAAPSIALPHVFAAIEGTNHPGLELEQRRAGNKSLANMNATLERRFNLIKRLCDFNIVEYAI